MKNIFIVALGLFSSCILDKDVTATRYAILDGIYNNKKYNCYILVKEELDISLFVDDTLLCALPVLKKEYLSACFTNYGHDCEFEMIVFDLEKLSLIDTTFINPGIIKYRYQDRSFIEDGIKLIGNIGNNDIPFSLIPSKFNFVLENKAELSGRSFASTKLCPCGINKL